MASAVTVVDSAHNVYQSESDSGDENGTGMKLFNKLYRGARLPNIRGVVHLSRNDILHDINIIRQDFGGNDSECSIDTDAAMNSKYPVGPRTSQTTRKDMHVETRTNSVASRQATGTSSHESKLSEAELERIRESVRYIRRIEKQHREIFDAECERVKLEIAYEALRDACMTRSTQMHHRRIQEESLIEYLQKIARKSQRTCQMLSSINSVITQLSSSIQQCHSSALLASKKTSEISGLKHGKNSELLNLSLSRPFCVLVTIKSTNGCTLTRHTVYLGQVYHTMHGRGAVKEINLSDGIVCLAVSSGEIFQTLFELCKSDCVWDNCEGISLAAMREYVYCISPSDDFVPNSVNGVLKKPKLSGDHQISGQSSGYLMKRMPNIMDCLSTGNPMTTPLFNASVPTSGQAASSVAILSATNLNSLPKDLPIAVVPVDVSSVHDSKGDVDSEAESSCKEDGLVSGNGTTSAASNAAAAAMRMRRDKRSRFLPRHSQSGQFRNYLTDRQTGSSSSSSSMLPRPGLPLFPSMANVITGQPNEPDISILLDACLSTFTPVPVNQTTVNRITESSNSPLLLCPPALLPHVISNACPIASDDALISSHRLSLTGEVSLAMQRVLTDDERLASEILSHSLTSTIKINTNRHAAYRLCQQMFLLRSQLNLRRSRHAVLLRQCSQSDASKLQSALLLRSQSEEAQVLKRALDESQAATALVAASSPKSIMVFPPQDEAESNPNAMSSSTSSDDDDDLDDDLEDELRAENDAAMRIKRGFGFEEEDEESVSVDVENKSDSGKRKFEFSEINFLSAGIDDDDDEDEIELRNNLVDEQSSSDSDVSDEEEEVIKILSSPQAPPPPKSPPPIKLQPLLAAKPARRKPAGKRARGKLK